VIHQAKRCLVDYLAVALGGQSHESVDILLDYAAATGSRRQASIVGRRTRVSTAMAALVNGQAAHVLDFDDTYASSETTLHGTAPTYSAALAIGEWTHASGRDVLGAFVLGFEVAARVALALGPLHYDAGWHVTGTAGRFGGAAAAGKLLNLSDAQLATALGLVATQAGGMKAVYGTMTKALHAARAAHDGVVAALLAQHGFTCAEDALEAKFGFLELYTQQAYPERLVQPTAVGWAVLEDGFKPYPCGVLTHATIDGVLEALAGSETRPADVERVEARVNPYVATVTGKPAPTSGLEAKFSAQHCVAVVIQQRRGVRESDFADAQVQNAELRALRERVQLMPMPDYPKDRADVAVYLRDGRVLAAEVPHARGTASRPLDDPGLEDKFTGFAQPALGPRAAELLAACWALDQAPDCASLLDLTQPLRSRRALRAH
jgi:2-methylcitrate dehydratase PrpD